MDTKNAETARILKRHEDVLSSSTFKRIADTLNLPQKRVLDLGCGYGEYMQRFNEKSIGVTTTQAEVVFGKEHGLDIRPGNVERLNECISPGEQFDVFWANNLYEHILSPHSFLVNLKPYASPDSVVVLGVPMVPKIESLMKIKKFRGALATPHINFFTKKTIELTAQYAGWKIIDNRGFVLGSSFLDSLASPLVPHLYMIAKNDAEYRYPPKKLNEWQGQEEYEKLISKMSGH